jgi:glutamate--cysteine ligase
MSLVAHDHRGHALSHAAAEAFIAQTCFKTGPPGRVGVEIEHVVHDQQDPGRPVPAERLDRLIATVTLPNGGVLTREPGGQLELSTLPLDGPAAAAHAGRSDLAVLHQAASDAGLRLIGEGTDPSQPPRRSLHHPRYDAMEAYFDQWGATGRQMMCSTASVQITVEAGQEPSDIPRTWDLLHALGPTLVAMFANSPFLDGHATGWKSTRQSIWSALDPARTAATHHCRTANGHHPVDEYTDFVLDAPVMLISSDSDSWHAPADLTFRDWLNGKGRFVGLRAPTDQDLTYHLTTLFPPVRARGAFEVRYIDALPGDGWAVPLAVVCGLLDNREAGDLARDAVEPVLDCWVEAARQGLDEPELAKAASTCLELARHSLSADAVNDDLVTQLDDYAERYVSRGRCPADDRLHQGVR